MRYLSTSLIALAGLGINPVEQAVAQDPGGQPDWIEQAKILAQMEGTSVGEQVRRYRLQEKANKLDERFSSDPDYGGAQVERKGPNFKVSFAFKGSGKQRNIDDPELAGASTVVSAAHSIGEIQQERQRLTKLLRDNGQSAAFAVRFQELQLFPEDPARVKALIDNGTIVPASFVKVREGPAKREDEANIEGAGLMTGYGPDPETGVISNYRCVGGFSVTNGTISGLATAGHCDPTPGDLRTHRGVAIGTRKDHRYRVNGLDISWHNKAGDVYLNRVRTSATTFYSITAVAPQAPMQNTPVCLILKDDRQVCSYVWGTTYYPPSNTDGPYIVLDRDQAVGGDSGGPWFYGNTAYGLHQGNYVDPVNGLKYDQYTPAASLPRMGINVKVAQ